MARAKADGADVIVIDEELSPPAAQLEEESGLTVIDRQEVILEIFADRAQTREAVLQVALARMNIPCPPDPRLVPLSRQRGKGKMGGEGETQLEQTAASSAPHHQAQVRARAGYSQRATQRIKRQRTPVPGAAIVGYTNAGKSTLLNKLTARRCWPPTSSFATLDPTTRQLVLPDGRILLLTDNVGFIRASPTAWSKPSGHARGGRRRRLPQSTPRCRNPNVDQHHATTLAVLGELGAATAHLTVFNKTTARREHLAHLRARPRRPFISVHTAPVSRVAPPLRGARHRRHRAADCLSRTAATILWRSCTASAREETGSLDDGTHLTGRFPKNSPPLRVVCHRAAAKPAKDPRR